MLSLRPIGVIRTPYLRPEGTPVQPAYGEGVQGEVILDEEYAEGLADIEGFTHIWLIYWLHRSGPWALKVVPYRDTLERGLFATRAPSRPNPIGMSAVRLLQRSGRRLEVADLDILDGTPLLDIKPYLPGIDAHPDAKAGWFGESDERRDVADGRFHAPPGPIP